MNKKEIAEIKKKLKAENCCGILAGCYVDPEKNGKVAVFIKKILSVPEEEMFKYADILKDVLSGNLGKKLHNLGFPLEQEKKDGSQYLLHKALKDELNDDYVLDEIYDGIIKAYDTKERYLILLYKDAYDVPGNASDGAVLEDEETVYDFMVCAVCPVALSKAGLAYDLKEKDIMDATRNWMVEKPIQGFLFPAFNDRASDIHNFLYYSKKEDEAMHRMIDEFLRCEDVVPSKTQKQFLQDIVEATFGSECDYETVKDIQDRLIDLSEDENHKLDERGLKSLLQRVGAQEEDLVTYHEAYKENIGSNKELLVSNLVDTGKMEIACEHVSVKVDAENANLVEPKMVDGYPCIVIRIDGCLNVNGVNVPLDTITGKKE